MDKVSVVIPVYNADKYLKECLDSICGQTYENLEIICVDDNSKDKSKKILEGYQKNDSRIVLLHQSHQGAGEARNLGTCHAKGEFIIFLDADDCFDKYMIEKAVHRIKKDNADMVIFGAEYFFDDNRKQTYDADWMLNRNIVGKSDFIEVKDSYGFLYDFTGCNPWNKLIRKKVVLENHLYFQNIEKSNDVFFICMALLSAKRIALLDDKLVFYRINKAGIQGTDSGIGMEYYEALKAVQRELKYRDIYPEIKNSFKRMCLRHCIDKLWKSDDLDVFQILFQKFFEMQEQLDFVSIEEEELEDYYLLKKWQIINAGKSDWQVIYNCRPLIDVMLNEIMNSHKIISDLTKHTTRLERLVDLMNKKKEWKVPYEKIGNRGNLVIYGAGDAGQEIYSQLNSNRNFKIVNWVDKNDKKCREEGLAVENIEEIRNCKFDKIIIAISEDKISIQIKNDLSVTYGIDSDKIICI